MPIFQPVLGGVGTGLTWLTDSSKIATWGQIKQLPNILDTFTDKNFKQSVKETNDLVQLNRSGSADGRPYQGTKNLLSAANKIGASIDQYRQ